MLGSGRGEGRAEAPAAIQGVDGLKAKVRGLPAGLEAELSLVVDVRLPIWRLVDAGRAFQETFPTVSLRLYVESLGAVSQMVIDGGARFASGAATDRSYTTTWGATPRVG